MNVKRPLRAHADVVLGRQRSPEHAEGPNMVPYLRAANVKEGTLDLSDVKEMNFSPREQKLFQLLPSDVLVTEGSGSLSTVGASAVWNTEIDGVVCFQNTLLRLRPRSATTDPAFLAWWCRYAFDDHLFASISTGANIYHLSAERVRSIVVSFPPLERQRAIVHFLDVETARIDALIARKRALDSMVVERFGVWIRKHLRSLDAPILPLKRHWNVADCKHRTPTYVDDGYPVMSPGDATAGRSDLSRCTRFVNEDDFADLTEGGRQPTRGDIIYSRNASIGIACYVDTDEPFCMGQDVCLISSVEQDQLYLMYVLNSLGVDQLEMQKIGSTFSRINVGQILDLSIPTPNAVDQRRIALQIDEAKRVVDAVHTKIASQIALLEERRRALITGVVTGEMEVPGVVA